MSKSSRVFVIQQPVPNSKGWTPNLGPAARFGALHFVFSGSDKPYSDPDGAIFQCMDALQSFNPESDYILWPNTGDYAALYAFCMMAGTVLAGKKVRYLYWQRKYERGRVNPHDGFYITITFKLPRAN